MKKQNVAFAVTVISINTNDIFCGLYLSLIWTIHTIYKETFATKEEWWRSSHMCFVAFFIVLFFTVLTQLLLMFLSLSRLMVVLHPVDYEYKIKTLVVKSIALMYFISGLFSFCITV